MNSDASEQIAQKQRDWALDCGQRYWRQPEQRALIAALMPAQRDAAMPTPALQYKRVPLPDWAADLGAGDPPGLLVDKACLLAERQEAKADWEACDWVGAAWLHLTGAHERVSETRRGSAHSYSAGIANYQTELYDYSWVNRIFLFLRRWASRQASLDELVVFGAVPAAELVLTHDVDALSLTPEIRFKQGTYQILNGAREAARLRLSQAGSRLRGASRFALTRPSWWTFAEIRRLEEKAGLRSVLHFYGGAPGWRRGLGLPLLMDPAYDVANPALLQEIAAFRDGGWTIGLHGSWRSWRDGNRLDLERARIETVANAPIRHTRQHWLRFSWEETWRAQQAAGLAVDSTLGFNNRPGFRNGAALAFRPWDHRSDQAMGLTAIPMVLMDSQFYDYQLLDPDARLQAMSRWIDEVRTVGGVATVNWHTHTIVEPYGWGEGYRDLLACL